MNNLGHRAAALPILDPGLSHFSNPQKLRQTDPSFQLGEGGRKGKEEEKNEGEEKGSGRREKSWRLKQRKSNRYL